MFLGGRSKLLCLFEKFVIFKCQISMKIAVNVLKASEKLQELQ